MFEIDGISDRNFAYKCEYGFAEGEGSFSPDFVKLDGRLYLSKKVFENYTLLGKVFEDLFLHGKELVVKIEGVDSYIQNLNDVVELLKSNRKLVESKMGDNEEFFSIIKFVFTNMKAFSEVYFVMSLSKDILYK